VAGADRVFHKAQATINGEVVTVWSEEVKEPVALRYCFHNVPDGGNLKNMYGIPAMPFRTDRWNDIK
jgi:sialate O-acetylesterase